MEKIEQSNILIAEFMGYKFHNDAQGDFPNGYWCEEHNSLPMFPEDFCYNDTWNWLMPVVEKIEALGYGFHKDPFDLNIVEYLTGYEEKVVAYQNDPDMKLIDKWYYVVVEFINYFNSKSGGK